MFYYVVSAGGMGARPSGRRQAVSATALWTRDKFTAFCRTVETGLESRLMSTAAISPFQGAPMAESCP